MNQAIQIMMNQLKARNPQIFQMIEQARINQNNPIEVFKQVTSKYSTEQMDSFYKQAKNMGFSDELINEVKNGINTK